jgi:hypothetical protein
MDGAVGDGSGRGDTVDGSNGPGPNKLPQIKLPEGQQEPVVLSI